MLGLVLTAGGARGAYQAGVLKRLSELPTLRDQPSPFAIIAGASAGAINGALLAARSEHFGAAASEAASVWSNLRIDQVFRTDVPALAWRGATPPTRARWWTSATATRTPGRARSST